MAAEKKVYFQTQPLLQKIEELHQKGQKAELDKRVAQWQEFVKKYPFLDKMISDKLKQILLGGAKTQTAVQSNNPKLTAEFLAFVEKNGKTAKDFLDNRTIINSSPLPFFSKPENDGGVQRFDSFFNLLESDGIATCYSNEMVYKITIAASVNILWILPNGEVFWGTPLITSSLTHNWFWKAINWTAGVAKSGVGGGWIQRTDLAPTDNAWNALFEAARTNF